MKPYLSVIVPVLNEEKNIPRLISRLIKVIRKDIKKTYEIILIDDGSTDKTWSLIKKYHRRNKKIKGISFIRNFGHQYALTAGINVAKGKIIFMLDGDLQHPPELLKKFMKKLDQGFEIVAGIRNNKEEIPFFKKFFSRFYYWLFNTISDIKMVPGSSDFRLISRKVADFIVQLSENNKFYRALFPWSGFKTFYLPYNAPKRARGKAQFSFAKSFYMGLGGIISFSITPLIISIYLGFLIASLAFLYGIYAVYEKLIMGKGPPGFTDLIASILFLGGIQLVSIGIVGIYIGRMITQLSGRPEYLVGQKCGLKLP